MTPATEGQVAVIDRRTIQIFVHRESKVFPVVDGHFESLVVHNRPEAFVSKIIDDYIREDELQFKDVVQWICN